MPIVYDELRRRAHQQLARSGGRDGALSTTGLVTRAYLRLPPIRPRRAGRTGNHFFGVAVKAMRSVVIDYARRHAARKRGGSARRIELDEGCCAWRRTLSGILAIHQALERLATLDGRLGDSGGAALLRGLSVEETAEVLGVSDRTVKRDWTKARTAALPDAAGRLSGWIARPGSRLEALVDRALDLPDAGARARARGDGAGSRAGARAGSVPQPRDARAVLDAPVEVQAGAAGGHRPWRGRGARPPGRALPPPLRAQPRWHGRGLPGRARGRAVRPAGRPQAGPARPGQRRDPRALPRASGRSWPACSTPHIARLWTAASPPTGSPTAMEHVDGRPIGVFCDQCRLGVRARVRLFLQVCDAVEYAHRNLVVHRDLKPSNVLVTAESQAKLLDFRHREGARPRPGPRCRA